MKRRHLAIVGVVLVGAGAAATFALRQHLVAPTASPSSALPSSSPLPSPSPSPSPSLLLSSRVSPSPSALPTAPSHAIAPPPVEARRARITRLAEDPALLAARDAVVKRFGGAVPGELAIQTAERPGGRGRVTLAIDATKPIASADAIAVALDDAGAIAWTKDRPAAGITPPIGPMAIAAADAGRVALAVCDPPTKRVALRVWDPDGSPFADFDAMDVEDCAAISLLYWPRRGFVIVTARAGETRGQLVGVNGALAWRRGVDLGARTANGAPASLAADGPDSFVLVQRGAASGDDRREHALAFRFDASAGPLWASPVDLGELPPDRKDERIPLARPRGGVVRATVAREYDVEITSMGTVSRVSR